MYFVLVLILCSQWYEATSKQGKNDASVNDMRYPGDESEMQAQTTCLKTSLNYGEVPSNKEIKKRETLALNLMQIIMFHYKGGESQ